MTASLAACGPPQDAGPGAASPSPHAAASASGTFTWEAHEAEAGARRYRLYVPAGYTRARPAPLVLMLHGCTQDPDDFARGTRMNALADEAGAIVVYPEQAQAHQVQKCWNWYDPAHQRRTQGEPAILAGIVQHVMSTHNVDPARVYVVGVSAGGAMAAILAAAYPDLFAAAGVHSGIAFRGASTIPEALAAMRTGPTDAAPLAAALREAVGGGRLPPLIVLHGADDPVVSPRNGERLFEQWSALGERAEPTSERSEMGGLDVERKRIGNDLELWMIHGLGHAWSGGSPEGTYTEPRGPDATREILRFLLEHPRR